MKHVDGKIFLMLLAILVSALSMFLYSFFGQLTKETYMDIVDVYYESNWLNLPLDLKKSFVVMIANAQRPICYDGFGVAFLNLDTFLKVILRHKA